jgi:hypothetical protein
MTVDEETGDVSTLKLLRLKLDLLWALPMWKNTYAPPEQVPIDRIGCNLKLQFLLQRYPNHLCKVYKRLRYTNPAKREGIVRDWKIKVLQLDSPHSEDYIVFRRLPCLMAHVEGVIQRTLEVRHNKRIIPSTILHLYWNIFDIVVYSQKFYDFN